MKFIKPVLALAALCASALPAGAFAPAVEVGGAQFSIGIVGYVPVICRAHVDASAVAPVSGTTSLGMLKEFCNSPSGYRVIADYSPQLATAKLVVDGVPVALSAEGSTVVSQSDSPKIADHSLALELPQDDQTGTISFRIELR